MDLVKRLIYLFYYIKAADFSKLKYFVKYVKQQKNVNGSVLILDAIVSTFKYNVSLTDYFYFRFFEKDKFDRSKWAGTGYMYEYQLKMNPKKSRHVLANKILFLKYYRDLIMRDFLTLEEIKRNLQLLEHMMSSETNRIVLKNSMGQIGAEVEVIKCSDYSVERLIEYMERCSYDLVEEYVIQHEVLMDLSPSGLNTVRIFTQLENGTVDILGARLRISVDSFVDNMAAGNLAAPIDAISGVVYGPGVYSDITKEEQELHPITRKAIVGLVIPFWQNVIELVKEAALRMPENRSVGWDIAITSHGPELIEGNHNWCKLLWQLPVRMGLKQNLEKYLR